MPCGASRRRQRRVYPLRPMWARLLFARGRGDSLHRLCYRPVEWGPVWSDRLYRLLSWCDPLAIYLSLLFCLRNRIASNVPCVLLSGTYASVGATACWTCSVGKVDTDSDPTTPCASCQAGRYASDSSTCTPCAPPSIYLLTHLFILRSRLSEHWSDTCSLFIDICFR